MKRIVILIFLTIAINGCAQQSFIMSNEKGELKEEVSQMFFIEGIAQNKELNASEICGGIENVSRVEVQQTFFNGILSFATVGIYTPRDARVYCK